MNHLVSKIVLLSLFSSYALISNPLIQENQENPLFIPNPIADQFIENPKSTFWNNTTHYDDNRRDNQTGRDKIIPTIAVMNYSCHDTLEKSLQSLQQSHVSAHYMIDKNGETVEVVNPKKRAYHAGMSIFKPESAHPLTDINSNSVGIIFVNDAKTPYTSEQTQAAILLLTYLKTQKETDLRHIIGHGEVAVDRDGNYGRKIGPGISFPWKELSQAGFGMYPQLSDEQRTSAVEHFKSEEDRILWMQHAFNKYGYNCPITGKNDKQTSEILKQFQIHYRPTAVNGIIDNETLHIMNDILKQVNEKTPKKSNLQPPCFE